MKALPAAAWASVDHAKLNVVEPRRIPSHDGFAVASVRDEVNGAPAAVERRGLTAVALALAEILDDPRNVMRFDRIVHGPRTPRGNRRHLVPAQPPTNHGTRLLSQFAAK